MSDRPMTVGSRCAAALLFGLGLSAATSSASADDGALTLYRSFNREFATWTTDAMRRVCREAGGARTVRLPRKVKRVTDLLTGETLAENADAFTADFATPDTRLFETEY